VSDAGHFVHYESPETANREMLEFFSGLVSGGAWGYPPP
jgi:pimeloyl-ACP methyl ester carboxylesterase